MNTNGVDGTLLDLTREVAATGALVAAMADRLEAVETKVDALRTDLTRYKGVLGGITLVVTAAWAALTTFKDRW